MGGGRPNRPGGGVGIGIVAERCRRVFKPPPGVGGGRPNRPGVGVGSGPWVLHVCRTKASATRPPCGGSGADATAPRNHYDLMIISYLSDNAIIIDMGEGPRIYYYSIVGIVRP